MSARRLQCALFGLLVGCLSPITARADEPVNIKLQGKVGDRAYLQFDQVVDTHGKTPAGPMHNVVHQIMGAYQTVEAPKSGKGMQLGLTWDRISIDVENPVQPLMFDTDGVDDSGPAGMMGQFFRPLRGQSIALEIGEDGQITKLRGLAKVKQNLEQAVNNPALFSQLSSTLDEETNKQMWGTSRLILYPNKPVKPGDTWTAITHQKGRTATLRFDYKLKFDRMDVVAGRKTAFITYDGSVTPDPAPAASEDKPAISGTFNGTGEYDIEAGQIMKQTQNIEMQAVRSKPGATQPAEPESRQKITQTYTLMPAAMRDAEKAKAVAATQAASSAPATQPMH